MKSAVIIIFSVVLYKDNVSQVQNSIRVTDSEV